MAVICNLTTDLSDVYSDLAYFRRYRRLDGFVSVGSDIWELRNTGYVDMIFEDKQAMTRAADDTDSPSAGEFSYHSAEDKIRVQFTGSKAPSVLVVEQGLDWPNFLSRMRAKAQEEIEEFLRPFYVIPFQKIAVPYQSNDGASWPLPLIRAVAELTVSNIINAVEPGHQLAVDLRRRVDLDVDASSVGGALSQFSTLKGFIQKIRDGNLVLRLEKTKRFNNGYELVVGASNSSTAFVRVSGDYNNTLRQIWQITIDGAGAVGTATFKWSKDNGSTFKKTTENTLPSTPDFERRYELDDGLFIEFIGTFSLNDTWDIHLFTGIV